MPYQPPYTKGCTFCGRTIRMKQMPPYGQWVAFDLDDENHDCSKVKPVSSFGSHALNIKPSKPKPYASLPFEDFELSLAHEGLTELNSRDDANSQSGPAFALSSETDANPVLVEDDVVQRIADAIQGYPSTDFRMSAHAFWKLFDYPDNTQQLAFPIIHALRKFGVEMRIISPQAGNEQIGYWVSLRVSGGIGSDQQTFLMNITDLPKPRPISSSTATLPAQAQPDGQIRKAEDLFVNVEREPTMTSPDLKGKPDAESTSVTPLPMGQVLRLLRLRDKLTLEDLAGRADISASHLSRLERDETSPSFAVVVALTRELGVTIDELENLRRSPGDLLNVIEEPPRKQEFGRLIRERRQELGLTLDEVADGAGISTSHLSRLERGQTKPSFTVIGAIARVLQLDVDDIVAYEREVEEIGRSFLGNLSSRIRKSLDSSPVTENPDANTDVPVSFQDERRIDDPEAFRPTSSVVLGISDLDEVLSNGITWLDAMVRESTSGLFEIRSTDFWRLLGVSRRTMRNVRRVTEALVDAGLTVSTSGSTFGMEPLDDVVTVALRPTELPTMHDSDGLSAAHSVVPVLLEIENPSTSSHEQNRLERSGSNLSASHCSNCGIVLANGARYCHRCGQRATEPHPDDDHSVAVAELPEVRLSSPVSPHADDASTETSPKRRRRWLRVLRRG